MGHLDPSPHNQWTTLTSAQINTIFHGGWIGWSFCVASEVFYHHRHFPVADMPILPANQYSFCFFKMKQTWHVGSTSYMTSYFRKDYWECEWWQIYTYFFFVIASGMYFLLIQCHILVPELLWSQIWPSFHQTRVHGTLEFQNSKNLQPTKVSLNRKLNIWKRSIFLTVTEGKKSTSSPHATISSKS